VISFQEIERNKKLNKRMQKQFFLILLSIQIIMRKLFLKMNFSVLMIQTPEAYQHNFGKMTEQQTKPDK
jgi:hypothetical protein